MCDHPFAHVSTPIYICITTPSVVWNLGMAQLGTSGSGFLTGCNQGDGWDCDPILKPCPGRVCFPAYLLSRWQALGPPDCWPETLVPCHVGLSPLGAVFPPSKSAKGGEAKTHLTLDLTSHHLCRSQLSGSSYKIQPTLKEEDDPEV